MRSLDSVLACAALAVVTAIGPAASRAQSDATTAPPSEREQIAEEALVYGLPIVMNYGVMYEYFVDQTSPEYKAPFNRIYNTARVYTPADTAVVTPNSDTPYSFVGLDLRAEPFVICNPEIEASRYWSLQLIDLYTFNFGYAGSRTTGNRAACHMITGPGWTGEKPEGIDRVFPSETELGIALIRTQLFRPDDLEDVEKIQAGYRALPLSQFLGKPAPPAAPAISWPKIDKKTAAADPFAPLGFLLGFAPPIGPAAVERPLRERLARIGIEAGKPFPVDTLTPEQKAELQRGIERGLARIKAEVAQLGSEENGWRVATHAFGDRASFAGDWTRRAAAAMAGIYGNDAAEALYPMLVTDAEGQAPDCSQKRYTLTFPAGQLPPANAFWSVTMYDRATQLLVENPIDRYLINSPMLPDMKKNPDGSLTLHLQHESPGPDRESNWLPAPNGPIYVVMRLYWPGPEALDGSWKPPAIVPVP